MISVCMATYNGARFIERQLSSILCQLGNSDEVIISDDGSTDGTLEIISKQTDPRIRVINGPHRHSPVFNFERAMGEVRGEFIFLSDQDDEWIPNKVKVMLQYLRRYSCVISDCRTIDGEGHELESSFYAINGTHFGRWYNLLLKNGYLGCCMAFRRCVMQASMPFPPDIPMHDIWIGNIAAFHFTLCFIPDKLVSYRRHGDNTSSAAEPSKYTLYEKLRFRWILVRRLFFCKSSHSLC